MSTNRRKVSFYECTQIHRSPNTCQASGMSKFPNSAEKYPQLNESHYLAIPRMMTQFWNICIPFSNIRVYFIIFWSSSSLMTAGDGSQVRSLSSPKWQNGSFSSKAQVTSRA
ncbi:hypothetical protein CDAR_99231 [Caerostris darwini]|uniref:Uncharacterized protein n=1 Tax=Caerostris darwini TaxID=1538125 RepID=A0AAV4Q509_9ARAC|nr:hypothetical protein CDAR_99231 [Caerostris darwini]